MDLNIVISLSNALILLSTLIVIIFYTIETKKFRQISEKTYALEKQKLKPKLIAFFDPNPKGFEIKFFVKNVGGSTAKNINVNVKPFFNFGDNLYEKLLIENEIFKSALILLNPNDFVDVIVSSTIQASGLYKENKIPKLYKIIIKYSDLQNIKYCDEFECSVAQFFNRIIDSRNSVDQLIKINESLKGIKDAINNRGFGKRI